MAAILESKIESNSLKMLQRSDYWLEASKRASKRKNPNKDPIELLNMAGQIDQNRQKKIAKIVKNKKEALQKSTKSPRIGDNPSKYRQQVGKISIISRQIR